MIAALLLAALQAVPAGAAPRTLHVGPGEAFSHPAEALAAAAPGDTVRVAAGLYRGALEVGRRVALVGEPGAVLDGGGRGTVVTLAADSASLAGFTVRGGGRSLDADDAAVKLVRCDGCRVSDVTVERALHGIYLLESNGATVERSRIGGDAALAEARRGNGIHLFHSEGSRIAGNVVRGTRDGIYFSFSGHSTVEGNDVAEVRYGLHYMYSDDNVFRGNRFARGAAGAAIMFSKRIVLRENVFRDHVGYRAYGLLLQTSEGVRAERNRFEGNLTGLFLDNATTNHFRENAVVGNGLGIDLMSSAEANLFTGNAIAGNRVPVRRATGGGVNRWAEDGRGNFWGDAAVFDLDGDGVGDRPYRAGDAFATLAAGSPALAAFEGTLAARALSWAEEAFPAFRLARVEDPAPLVAPPHGIAPAAPSPTAPAASAATAEDASPDAARAAALLLLVPAVALLAHARRPSLADRDR